MAFSRHFENHQHFISFKLLTLYLSEFSNFDEGTADVPTKTG